MTRVPSVKQNSILDQPKAVWAVAFAAVIAFMGIGLIGPILPTVTAELEATPTQTSLLFTSYLAVTGLGMFFTSWVSARLGFRVTLMLGLLVIVVASALAGFATSVEALILFRAVWGLGNALFISTALASIVSAAKGSAGSAIIIYEAALGLGIAMGPLTGGLLGTISWQAPFFGTAVLMLIAFCSILFFLPRSGGLPARATIGAPFRALAVPAILVLAIAAFLYNVGFFVLMSYTPYPLGFTSLGIGMVFTGWGLGVALTSVFGAPLLTRRVSPRRVLWIMLMLFAATLAAAGLAVENTAVLVVMVIVGGLVIGVVNTVLTECVMEASNLPRAVASSSYSGVRFLGGALAPPIAAALAAALTPTVPFLFGAAGALLAAVLVLSAGRVLGRTERTVAETPIEQAQTLTLGE